jgi:MFS family permease
MTPINGRLTDIIGRKPVLYAAIIFVTVFSALSGAATDISWRVSHKPRQ